MSYHFESLGDERFQQFAQALLVNIFPNAQCLPVGQPDGGRDAFSIQMGRAKGRELIIFQVKFSRDYRAKSERDSLLAVIESEKEKVKGLIKKGAKSYYLITNVSGTSHLDVGSIDKANEILTSAFGIPSYCWWRDDIEARVSNNVNLKWSFPEIMKGTDILQLLVEGSNKSHLEQKRQALRSYIASQYSAEREVKFKQVELQNDLLDLFVELPTSPLRRRSSRYVASFSRPRVSEIEYSYAHESVFVADVAWQHNRQVFPETCLMFLNNSSQARIVLEGAPGQGKSTITQHLCQVNRIKILEKQADLSRLPDRYRHAAVKIPFRIDLRDYATWISGRSPFTQDSFALSVPDASLETFVAAQVNALSGGQDFTATDLLSVTKDGYIVIVLDGFDEVADIPVRRRMVDEITKAAERIQSHVKSAQIIVTSRPAAFANSPGFEHEDWSHYEIQSMSPDQIADYSKKWMTARRLPNRERTDFSRLLNEKLTQPHMRDLARNPMQLTILLALIHTRGLSLPDKRTALYDNYMELFFNRESEKSRVVREYRDLLIDIHRFLAWTLHAAAEGGAGNGSVTEAQLKRILRIYLEKDGHDTLLVDHLFTGMVERVVALVSRVQGTFEFEVQPLREYFAARHLYETAPYSPPGGERNGTKPDRFDALIRNFYWLNVLRFYCGCYSRGELPSLVDGLCILSSEKGYEHVDHTRTVSLMLLSDWVFTQQPLSVKRVISLFFSQPGLKIFLSNRTVYSPSGILLPDRCGRADLVHEAYDLLRNITNTEERSALLGIVARNTSSEDRQTRWESEEPPVRLDSSIWFSDGLSLGVITNLSTLRCVELIGKYGEIAISNFIKAGYYKVLHFDREIYKRSINFILAKSTLSNSYMHRTKEIDTLQAIGQLSSLYMFKSVWENESKVSLRQFILSQNPYTVGFEGFKKIKPESDFEKRVIDVLEAFSDFIDCDVNVLAATTHPWENFIETCVQKLGPYWAFKQIAIVSAGIGNVEERGAWTSDCWKTGSNLCSSMRYARLRSGNVAWWRKEIQKCNHSNSMDLVCAMIFTWGTPLLISSLIDDVSDCLERMTVNEYNNIVSAVRNCRYVCGQPGKGLRFDNFYDSHKTYSYRFLLLAGIRFGEVFSRSLVEKFLPGLQTEDVAIIEFFAEQAVIISIDKSQFWNETLRVLRIAHKVDVSISWINTMESMPVEIAERVCAESCCIPGDVVRVAQQTIASHLGQLAPKVGSTAEKDGWFANY